MSDQNPLDDFLKRKLSERTYSFQESYWDAAEGLIEADRKKKKRRAFLWWWIGGLGLLAISLGTALMWNTGKQGIGDSTSAIVQCIETPSLSLDSTQITQSHPNGPKRSDSKQASLTRQQPSPSVVLLSPEISQKENKGIHTKEGEKEASQVQVEMAGEMPVDLSARSSMRVPDTELIDVSIEKIYADEATIGLGTIDSIQAQEYLFTHSIQQSLQLVSLSEHVRKNYLGIRLGYVAAEGFQNMGSSISPRSYQGFAGIHYARRLGRRLRLHSGLEYETRSGLNSDSTYRSTAYSFGFQTQSTTISPQKLHSLELPLYLELRIKNRHYVQVGGSASYLLNVSSLVSKGIATDFGAESPTSERVWGYRQGFKTVDASVLAGYQYYLGRGLYLGIHSRYGLRDLTDPAFFGNENSDRNIRWQLSLTYDFLNF